MSRIFRTSVAFAALLVGALVRPGAAQGQLRIIRHTPSDSATSGAEIAVMFDRPVAGLPDRPVDPGPIIRVEPAIAGTASWRDPVTLRFTPAEPLRPGTTVTVTIDTAFRAVDGTRLAARYRYTTRIPGPRPLGHTVSRNPWERWLAVRPTLRVLYSAPVDLEALRAGSRLEFAEPCAERVVPLTPVSARPLRPGEYFPGVGGYDRDTIAQRFNRVVEFTTPRDLPSGCKGFWHIPSLDPTRPDETWKYNVETPPPLILEPPRCSPGPLCEPGMPRVGIGSPPFSFDRVSERELTRRVRVTALRLPRDASDPCAPCAPPAPITLRTPLPAGTIYRITVDSALRDRFGQPLTGPHQRVDTVHNFYARTWSPRGVATVPRNARTVRTEFVNAESLTVIAIPLPDSLRHRMIAASGVERLALFLDTVRVAMRDTFRLDVAVSAPRDARTSVDVPLPPQVGALGGPALWSVRVRVKTARTISPVLAADAGIAGARRRIPIVANATGWENADRLPRRTSRFGWGEGWEHPLGLLLQVSDLAVHAKFTGDSARVFVTSLAGGGPVAGVDLTLYDAERRVLAQGRSDADGFARLARTAVRVPTTEIQRDPGRDRNRYIEATRGADRMFMGVGGSLAGSHLMSGHGGGDPLVRGAILSDRDIYRPGEMLYVKLVARTGVLGAMSAPAGDSVRWRLVDDSGEEPDTLVHRVMILSRFGTAADSARLPGTARPTTYALEAEVLRDGQWVSLTGTNPTVNEYRAPELEVRIDADTATPLRDGVLTVPVRARYLFGAPVVRAPVQWSARTVATPPRLPKALRDSGYFAGAPSEYWEYTAGRSRTPNQGTDTTDATGEVRLSVPTTSRVIGVDGALRISAAVADVSNQVVTDSRSIPLPPPPFHIAVRRVSGGWMVPTGSRQEFRVLALARDGTLMSDVAVRMRVVRPSCVYDQDAYGRAGGGTCTSDTVARAVVTTGATPVTVAFTPDSVGRHDVVFDAADSAGNPTLTVYASINADTTIVRSHEWQPGPQPPALVLRTDSTPHPLGDTARVVFESPFALADAWITREREGVLEQRRLTVRRGTVTLPFAITERDAPEVWVGVLLVPRGDPLRAGLGTVDSVTRVGYAKLRVDSTAKKLTVEIAPRDSVSEPGDTTVIRIHVRDASPSGRNRGVRSEVALWAVDEGVLSLTGFQTPMLLSRMYGRSGLGASLQSVFSPRYWQLDRGAILQLSSVVATSAPVAFAVDVLRRAEERIPVVPDLRADFRSTAFFVGALVTDASGNAEARVKLPDNITTYRLMAVAVTEGDRYGSGEGKLLATQPLVARPSLPRFVRQGDTLTAGASINVRDGSADRVQVTTSVTGISLRGDSTASVTLPAGETGRARFNFGVSPTTTAATARIRFTATGGAGADAVETDLPIRSATIPRTHTQAGMLTGNATVSMTLPAGLDPARSRLSIHLGSSPLAAIRSNYERLRDYPYRSSDAIASAGSALLALARTERALGVRVSGVDSANIVRDLERAADELALRELDGWIVFWRLPDPHPHTNAWLTAYAGTFLLEAQRAGARVRPSILAAIRTKLTEVATDSIESLRPDTITGSPTQRRDRVREWLAARVVAARFIREAGAPDTAAENALLALAPKMVWEDRLVLTEILALRGDRDLAREMLRDAWTAVSTVGRRIDLPDSLRSVGSCISHIRPAARLLIATMRLQPSHPLIGALVETVTQQGRAERRWAWNTQDYASASSALAAFAVSQRGSGRRTVVARSPAGATVLTRTVGAESADSTVALTGLLRESGDSARLSLALSATETSAATPLYYALTVEEIPRVRPVTPDIKGLVVERWFESFLTGATVSEVREGDLVRVRLRLTVPADRQFVVLEDLLPAGLEAVDLSLRTSSTLGPFATTPFAQSRAGSSMESSGPILQSLFYGSWDSGWWSPWEYKEMRDDRVIWFARQLWTGSYTATYLARATTAGKFVLPPAHAEEMYDRAVQGRSAGGVLLIR